MYPPTTFLYLLTFTAGPLVGVCLYTHCPHFPLLVTLQLLYLTPAPLLHMHFVTKVRVTNSGVHFSIPTSLLL